MNEQPLTSAEDRPVKLDPTSRTMEVVLSQIGALKELVGSELGSMKEAVKLLQSNADKSPTVAVVFEKVMSLEAVNKEKFASIDKQFAERDTRTEQTSRDNKVAIDAALQAQKEAVAKSEVGFTKQIDNIGTLIEAKAKAADDKIDAVKATAAANLEGTNVRIGALDKRLDLNEGRSKGMGDGYGYLVGGVGVVIAIVTMIFVVLKFAGNG